MTSLSVPVKHSTTTAFLSCCISQHSYGTCSSPWAQIYPPLLPAPHHSSFCLLFRGKHWVKQSQTFVLVWLYRSEIFNFLISLLPYYEILWQGQIELRFIGYGKFDLDSINELSKINFLISKPQKYELNRLWSIYLTSRWTSGLSKKSFFFSY